MDGSAFFLRVALATAMLMASSDSQAQTAQPTPQQAYRQGCAGCHTSEAKLLRKLPRGDAATMRAWLTSFMAGHPCEADRLKPLIIDYLVSKTAK